MSTTGVVSVTQNAANVTVAYACQQLVQDNTLTPIDIVYFYDLVYQGDLQTVLARVEAKLLERLAITFEIKNGNRCTKPPSDSVWLVQISSNPVDQAATEFTKCLDLNPTATAPNCTVIRGEMTGLLLVPLSDNTFFLTAIAQAMLSGAVTNGTNAKVAFLGTKIDKTGFGGGNDGVPSSINGNQNQSQDGRKSVTIFGGAVVALFCVAFIGIFVMLYRRRKRQETAREVELALSKSDAMNDKDESPTLQQDALSDDMAEGAESISMQLSASSSHAMDLGMSLRNEMMGVHGRNSAAVTSALPRAMDETSDNGSDADSWAQTDGTIGSLELQLEPITAEV